MFPRKINNIAFQPIREQSYITRASEDSTGNEGTWKYEVPKQTLTLYKGEITQGSYDALVYQKYNITLKQQVDTQLTGLFTVKIQQASSTNDSIKSGTYNLKLENSSTANNKVTAKISQQTITFTCGTKLDTLTNTGNIGVEAQRISLVTKLIDALEALAKEYKYTLYDVATLKKSLKTSLENVTFIAGSAQDFKLESPPYTLSSISISIEPLQQESITTTLTNNTITCTLSAYYRASTTNNVNSESLTQVNLAKAITEEISTIAATHNYVIDDKTRIISQLDCSKISIKYTTDHHIILEPYTWNDIILNLKQLPKENDTVTTTITNNNITCTISNLYPAVTTNNIPFKPFTQQALAYHITQSIVTALSEQSSNIIANLQKVQEAIDVSKVDYTFVANKFVNSLIQLNNPLILILQY